MTYPQHPSQPGQQSPTQFGSYPPPKKKDSKNGPVTVHDVKGDLLSNGNF
ncbi:hypothetical protein [Streptomyces tubercidicus]